MAFNKNVANVITEYEKYYGIDPNSTEVKVTCNASNEKKESWGLKVGDKETEYVKVKEDKDGNSYKQVTLQLYFCPKNSSIEKLRGRVFPVNFFISDVFVGPSNNTGKSQWINAKGENIWALATSTEELKELLEGAKEIVDDFNTKVKNKEIDGKTKDKSITSAQYLLKFSTMEGARLAYKGEVSFMEAIYAMFNLKTGLTTFNWNKIFDGNFSEITETLKDIIEYLKEAGKYQPFSVLYYIRSSEKTDEDGTTKIYYTQDIYTKAFTPSNIRTQLKADEEAGYPLNGIYMKDGILLNELNIFTPDMMNNNKKSFDFSDID